MPPASWMPPLTQFWTITAETLEPKAVLLLAWIEPSMSSVPPMKLLAPVRYKVPVPDLTMPARPAITPSTSRSPEPST